MVDREFDATAYNQGLEEGRREAAGKVPEFTDEQINAVIAFFRSQFPLVPWQEAFLRDVMKTRCPKVVSQLK